MMKERAIHDSNYCQMKANGYE